MTRAALAGWIVAAALVPAPVAGEVRIAVDRAALRLGAGERARVVVETTTGRRPSVEASAGTIGALAEAAPGRFEAEYVPPGELHPQIAILAAVDGEDVAWTVLPLVGRGRATVRSTRPGAEIVVHIGDASFGPVIADLDGVAQVPVVVPPGAEVARHGSQVLPLQVPAVSHVHAVLGATRAAADAETFVPVHVLAVAADGTPRAGAPLRVIVSDGDLPPPVERAPGAFVGRWRLGPGPPRVATLIARIADDPGPPGKADLSLREGEPAQLAVRASRTVAVAGDPAPVDVEVALVDRAGNPVAREVEVTATGGRLAPIARGGAARAYRLDVPERVGPERRVAVVARAGELTDRLEIALSPAAPDRLSLLPPDAAAVADGRSSVELRVVPQDRFGNPVDAGAPTVTATLGSVGDPRRDPEGGWRVPYRAPRVREGGAAELVASAAELHARAVLPLRPPRHAIDVAAKLGAAFPLGGARPSPVVAAEAWYHLRPEHRLGAMAELAWTQLERRDAAAGASVDTHAQIVTLAPSVTWRAPLGPGRLRVAPGGGISLLDVAVAVAQQPAEHEDVLAPCAHLSIAWGRRLWGGVPFVEVRAAWQSSGASALLDGSYRSVVAAAGFGYELF
ncbi:MAG TPA: hypothetical protein VFL83_18050 [Anaeromyxobacter sp.]|nr:hypothetical protein [Anaeromyxobacter sp.]